MILVLCDDQVIQPELLVDHVASEEEIDLTIACAGQPGNLDALKRFPKLSNLSCNADEESASRFVRGGRLTDGIRVLDFAKALRELA